jgi:hypothetical protein
MTDDRAGRAVEDVVAVEQVAPGLVRVVTWSDCHTVDARDAGCNCPDKQYHDASVCKHEYAAMLADVDRLPSPGIVTPSLSERVASDGGERPDECDCVDWNSDIDLPCWPCYRAGFETTAHSDT